MENELIKVMASINGENGNRLFYTYEGLPEFWRAYARTSYERLLQLKITNLGKQGAAELAVKVAKFLCSKVNLIENA